MSYCSKCGAQLSDGDIFCPKCGNPSNSVTSQETEEAKTILTPHKQPMKPFGIIIAAVLFISLIAGIEGYSTYQDMRDDVAGNATLTAVEKKIALDKALSEAFKDATRKAGSVIGSVLYGAIGAAIMVSIMGNSSGRSAGN